MSDKRFYVTTPIYYANDRPHIGHAYTTILADVLTRFHRLMGYEVFFLTGTDEHGQKVQQAAAKRGVTPQEHVDEYHLRFKELWQKLNIQYNHFIRTTDEVHKKYVQQSLQELHDKGEIYVKEYAGWYSVGEERFFSDDELVDGMDPISGRPVEWLTERNYFFKMSNYQERLIKHINDNPDFIIPDFRKNEVLGFLRQPLQDLCISRPKSRLAWGVELPFDSDFVTYVWFDALLNYETGVLGRTFSERSRVWPADYHLIGKDILTTHCVYWPCMLLGMDRELPRHILAHGWWLARGGKKQSKTSGNAVNPLEYIEEHGVDSVRYFLMRDMVLGQDAAFSDELFITRINTDLANDLGNGINRVNKFILSRFDGRLPVPGAPGEKEQALIACARETKDKALDLIRSMKLSFALEETANLVRVVNRYLETRAPWKMAQEEGQLGDGTELATVLWASGEALRVALCLLYPVMPEKTLQGLAMLGAPGEPTIASLDWGVLKGGEMLEKHEGLFPRIETKPEPQGKVVSDPASMFDFRVAEIQRAEEHPEADSLYVITLRVDGEERTVCAGLKKSYTIPELTGRKIVLLANLKPAKLRGVESRGMLLAADAPDGRAVLLDPGTIPANTLLRFGPIAPEPKAKISIKDFEKLGIAVLDRHIRRGEHALGHDQDLVSCDVPDGSPVH